MATILITGSTGMIGKGVLLEAIEDSRIDKIILVNRSPIDIANGKIKEIILKDFLKFDTIAHQLEKIDACIHCMGVSSVGMNESDYTKLTYDITKAIADVCYNNNPKMTFNYVSGQGTDSSESGRIMWARVKGKTENYLLKKGFEKSYMFRPGAIIPEKGIVSRTGWYSVIYKILTPFFPLLKKMKSITTTTKIGQAMLATFFLQKFNENHFENPKINELASKF